MSGEKKDITRIEDLGEFIHDIDDSENSSEFSEPPAALTEMEINQDTTEFISTPDFITSEETTELNFLESEYQEESPVSDENNFEQPAADFSEPTGPAFQLPTFEEEKEEVPETYKAPETFTDVKQFAESSSFSGMSAEGNPSFSVLVKNVRFIEDVKDIVNLMNELELLSDTEEVTIERLKRGSLLIPRISEFAAIMLAHKLRRFDIDIQIGLSDEIHPPKYKENPETGIVSKHSLYQNQSHHFHFEDAKLDIHQIIISAAPVLDGYHIVKYMGVASEHKLIDAHLLEDETSSEIPVIYQELAQKLKIHALKVNSNAVIGLNYQLTPLVSEFGLQGQKYRLTCTGNLVWINKI